MVSNVPDTVMAIFQEAIDKTNNNLINWIFKHRGMKLLSVLSLPYTVPADVIYATFTKYVLQTRIFTLNLTEINVRINQNKKVLKLIFSCFYKKIGVSFSRLMATAPVMGNSLWDLSKFFMDNLSHVLNRLSSNRQYVSAKITCQLDIAEYGKSK